MKFSTNVMVDQVCVIGSGLPQPMALLTLSETGRKTSTEELHAELKSILSNINSLLDPHEKSIQDYCVEGAVAGRKQFADTFL
jgi:long-chain acyl-CoA synthetase